MDTKVLGNSDLFITPVGFGAWAIGGDWEFGWGSQDDTQSVAAIHRALELGVNWIDTAAVYGLGHSEEVVARALQEWQGSRPYVFTKCGMIWNAQGKVDYSLRRESIRRECEASLRRLKTEVIDLYQIQGPTNSCSAVSNSHFNWKQVIYHVGGVVLIMLVGLNVAIGSFCAR
jgi:aryl-alcohol dehydrogenase-like predicted oxidoreductase